MKKLCTLLAVGAAGLPFASMADTIDPTSYSATLGVGESVTIRKTVTIETTTSSGVLDVVFLIDTSGSMGAVIDAAKAAAANILSGLAGFGNLATATGYYSEPGSDGTVGALTTNTATGIANINAINLLDGGGGGDFPEEGIFGTYDAALNTAWRPGSSRFIIALGDATFKESDGVTVAMTQAALASKDVTFIGIDFGNMTYAFDGISPQIFAGATGGSIVASSTNPATIVSSILSSVTSAFAKYEEVTVGDLGAGLPGVSTTVKCVSATSVGMCVGDKAIGEFNRSVERTFTFDVTFTGVAEGTESFLTHALVDGGIVASESDRIVVGAGGTDPTPVPEPTTLALLGAGILGLGLMRRRRA